LMRCLANDLDTKSYPTLVLSLELQSGFTVLTSIRYD